MRDRCNLSAAFVLGLILATPIYCAVGKPVDLSAPSGELGASNARGFLELWREVDGVGIELGKGSYLGLRYRFSTESDRAGALGTGFYVPMFEARNVLIREDTMLANLPCGKKVYLWRDPADASKFQTPDREWKGNLVGDDFTLWRDDGWKVLYQGGRLSSTISDDKRTTVWSYDAAGGGGIEQDGKLLITMQPGPGGQIADFVFAGKSYKVEYGKRPIIEAVAGQNVLKELVPALTTLTFPDGKAQTFEFGLNDERVPKLTAKDGTGFSTDYTWDAVSRHLTTEKNARGEWTYKVGEVAGKLVLPALSRTDNQGKMEGSQIDDKSGTYTRQTKDGTKMVTRVFENPGPLFHKVKSVEQISGNTTKPVSKFSYDEAGHLIRKIDAKGFTTKYAYDDKGKFLSRTVTPPTEPGLLAQLKEKETALLKLITDTPSPDLRGNRLEKLAFFYIHECGDPAKALALLPQMDNRKQGFNVQLHAIDGDVRLSGQQKADKFQVLAQQYPEQKHLLDILIAARPKEDARYMQNLSTE